jgi:hypothetical protein
MGAAETDAAGAAFNFVAGDRENSNTSSSCKAVAAQVVDGLVPFIRFLPGYRG